MKKLFFLLMILTIGSVFATDAGAHGFRRYYRPRVYIAPAPYGAPTPYYAPGPMAYGRPQYAPVYRDVYVQPHWIHSPYGRQWIAGHWVRQQCY